MQIIQGKYFVNHSVSDNGIKITAKAVDEDPASYKRLISRKEI